LTPNYSNTMDYRTTTNKYVCRVKHIFFALQITNNFTFVYEEMAMKKLVWKKNMKTSMRGSVYPHKSWKYIWSPLAELSLWATDNFVSAVKMAEVNETICATSITRLPELLQNERTTFRALNILRITVINRQTYIFISRDVYNWNIKGRKN